MERKHRALLLALHVGAGIDLGEGAHERANAEIGSSIRKGDW